MSHTGLSRAELNRLPRRGARRVHGAYFTLLIAPLNNPPAKGGLASGSKCTCAVSVKVARKAVERNRIKRLCRETVRKTALGQTTRPLAFVFYAKRGAVQASHADIARDIVGLLRRAAQ